MSVTVTTTERHPTRQVYHADATSYEVVEGLLYVRASTRSVAVYAEGKWQSAVVEV